MSSSGRFLEDVKEATVIYYKTYRMSTQKYRSSDVIHLENSSTCLQNWRYRNSWTKSWQCLTLNWNLALGEKQGHQRLQSIFPDSCVVAGKEQNYELSSSFATWHLVHGGPWKNWHSTIVYSSLCRFVLLSFRLVFGTSAYYWLLPLKPGFGFRRWPIIPLLKILPLGGFLGAQVTPESGVRIFEKEKSYRRLIILM